MREDPKIRRFLRQTLPRLRRAWAPESVWIFGSRARGDALESSDLDVLVVSSAFEGVPWLERFPRVFRSVGPMPGVEALYYTPREFRERRREIGIVAEAVREGIRVYVRPS
ncbi:MAG: nucleotidyltransferase domain-containing protein [Planctomycetes bacterium]|nr:nucleotidyltransferase domain-containing protein [Planctomycetota bacterium]